MLGGDRFFMFLLFDLRREAAGSRERRISASKRLCFIRFLCWNAIAARGLFSQSCSRAGRGSFFQCNFFRFHFGSIFGSIKASIKKGIEKGFEEESKLETWSLLGRNWGDGARGQYIYIYIYICIYIYIYIYIYT